jgi:propionyl-CoA carboxylase alpha chain
VGILRHEEFAAGDIDTAFLTRHEPAELALAATAGTDSPVLALAAALADQAARRAGASLLTAMPSGWRNVPNARQSTTYLRGDDQLAVEYRITGRSVDARVAGESLEAELWSCTPEQVQLTVDGIREHIEVLRVGDRVFVDGATGSVELVDVDRFPDPSSQTPAGSLLAPMPGTVVRVAVKEGDTVTAGAPVVVLEAMKMEHTVAAPYDGVVTEINAEAGRSVETGTVLAVVEQQEDES